MRDDTPPVLSDYLAKHYAVLKARAARLLGSGDLADDALQDTWLRVNSREAEEGPVRSPAAYLLRVAVNIAVDIVRRQARSLPLEDVGELMELVDAAPGPERVTEARMRIESLGKWMQHLPERQRLAVLLVHWEGLEQKEVARRLGVSLRTVESDLKRAHEYLLARKDR